MTLEPQGEGIRNAALRYAWHGWPIAPGIQSDRPCDSWPVPLAAALPYRGPMSPNDVVRYWQDQPYAVLLAVGLTIEVLEVDKSHGTELLQNRGWRGPLAVLPNERWLFFVEASKPLPTRRPDRNVGIHAAGSWVPLPPTRIGSGSVRWHINPASLKWRLFRHGQLDPIMRPSAQPQASHRPMAPASPLRPHQHPDRTSSRMPSPRHRTLLVAGDRATVQVTHVHQEAVG